MSEERVGRYIVKETLGSGGMATVFRAYDPQFGRDVALKMLPVGPGYDHDFLERKFQQEARIIASLEHFAIVPVYDFGSQDGRPFLVMRLMPGGTLKEHLSYGPVPLAEAQHVLDRISSALDKAHSRQIVHRDVKPTNIFLDDDGLVYLGDFGIARVTAGDQTNSRIGSPRYMAPEMVQGNPLIPQTDIYQMGIVLYEMLTGQLPFVGDTTEHTMMLHLQGEIPRPSAQNSTIPQAVDDVITMALAKSPQHRFRTAGELADAFRLALSGRSPFEETLDATDMKLDRSGLNQHSGSTPQPERQRELNPVASTIGQPPAESVPQTDLNPLPTTGSGPNRNRFWLIALSVVALLMLACGATIFALSSRDLLAILPEPDPTIAPPPTLGTATELGAETDTADADAQVPAEESEEGPGLAPTVTIEAEGAATATVEGVLALSSAELTERGGGSGQAVYAAKDDGDFDLFIVDTNGETRQLTNTPNIDEFNPTYSPDGQRIAYHAENPTTGTWEIYLVGVNGGTPRNLTNHPADDSFPAWSPDGRFIAFHTNRHLDENDTPQFDIYLIDVNTGETDRLTATSDTKEVGPTWSPDGREIAYNRFPQGGVGEIFIIDRESGTERQLTTLNARSENPIWSPDGTQLTFMSNVSGIYQIYVVDAATGAILQVSDGRFPAFHPTWSSNGDWVIYHLAPTADNRDLYMSRADGSETIQLTDTEVEERMPDYK